MGRIPGFTKAIFPSESIANLNNTANLGLILFLFLVGLETDIRLLISNWRVAFGVGAAGMILPFGLGCAIAYGLYHEFDSEPGTVPISFGVFMLFIGVAMAITVGYTRSFEELDSLMTLWRRHSQSSVEFSPNSNSSAHRLVSLFSLPVSATMSQVGFSWPCVSLWSTLAPASRLYGSS